MRKVEDHLVIAVGMYSRHGPADDLEAVVYDLGDRSQTVRRARRIRNNVVLGGIVLVLVDAQHDREVLVLCRSGDDDLLYRPAHMLLGIVSVGESAGRFDDDLRADGLPGQRGWVFFFENLNGFAVDGNVVGTSGDFVRQVSQDRIVLEQVGQSFRIGKVVDRNEFKILIFKRSAQHVAADAAKSINPYFYRHFASERVFDCDRRTCWRTGTTFDVNRPREAA